MQAVLSFVSCRRVKGGCGYKAFGGGFLFLSEGLLFFLKASHGDHHCHRQSSGWSHWGPGLVLVESREGAGIETELAGTKRVQAGRIVTRWTDQEPRARHWP